jgi:uncharacterized membrane protein YfcA
MIAANAALIVLGAGAGFLSGLLGIGGGIIYVPALMYFAAVPIHTAIGVSLVLIVPSAAAAALRHFYAGNVDLSIVAIVLPTALLGAFLGAYLSSYVSAPLLKKVFGIALILIGLNSITGFTDKLLAYRMKDSMKVVSGNTISHRVETTHNEQKSNQRSHHSSGEVQRDQDKERKIEIPLD